VILFGYIGVALVVGVSAAILAVVAARASDRLRLFLRCLRWGVATGAVTGAVIGAMVLLLPGLGNAAAPSLVGLTPVGVLSGAVIGALVSLIPSLIGAVFIADVVGQRRPPRSSEEVVQSDLTMIFRVVVGVLDAAVIVALIASGGGLSSVAVALPYIVVGNACVVLMLCRAKGSIGRLWSPTAR
jgi:hypothetical protein